MTKQLNKTQLLCGFEQLTYLTVVYNITRYLGFQSETKSVGLFKDSLCPTQPLLSCKHLLLVFAVVPVVSLMLAGQEVGPVVPLALHEFKEVLGTVVPLLQRQLGQVHLHLAGYHLCQRETNDQAGVFLNFFYVRG